MNAFHTRLLALLAVTAGAAHGADAPPSPASPPAPMAPQAPLPPMSPLPPSASSDRDQDRLERELQRAQEELNRAAREVAELSSKVREEAWTQAEPAMDFGMQHVMLGINIGAVHGRAAEATEGGVRIVSVSPGGPADQAGLKANDVIVSVAGKELHGDAKSTPQQQLLAQMRQAKADMPIALEYRRDGKVQKTQVTPKSVQEFTWAAVADAMHDMHDMHDLHGLDSLNSLDSLNDRTIRIWKSDPGGFGTAELADLSPGLGKYFGTDKGLLVVRAPKDDRLKLQDGDVILDIDGRVPGSPSHAYEILSSYRGGETLKLHVLRQQKRLELPIEVPENGHAGMSRLRTERLPDST
jgi:S1-C subfamily serine protease